jgi:hypothetical protein
MEAPWRIDAVQRDADAGLRQLSPRALAARSDARRDARLGQGWRACRWPAPGGAGRA